MPQGKPRLTVVVGMSGGVDSTVAASLLVQEGFEVIGVTMQIWDGSVPIVDEGYSGCYGPGEAKDIEDAQSVATRLGIPHYVIPMSEIYRHEVLDYFCREYRSGRTPNPCMICNRRIKFDALLTRIREQGIRFDRYATGHYAQVEYDETANRCRLKRAVDRSKDQTYFLAFLSQNQLRELVFPLGGMTKAAVKALARHMGFNAIVAKPESQNFIESRNYSPLFEGQPIQPGPIVDRLERVVGEHRGIVYYTIGQRRGLGISGKRKPWYVTAIRGDSNTVVVGSYDELFSSRLFADGMNWIAIEKLDNPMRVKAKIRQKHTEADALITPSDKGVEVLFDAPQMSITPGQAVVFYQDDGVIGGGTISKAGKDYEQQPCSAVNT